MSIDRIHRNIHFTCDECSETLDTDEPDFATAWASAKNEGWRAIKVGADWVHKCPECATIIKP